MHADPRSAVRRDMRTIHSELIPLLQPPVSIRRARAQPSRLTGWLRAGHRAAARCPEARCARVLHQARPGAGRRVAALPTGRRSQAGAVITAARVLAAYLVTSDRASLKSLLSTSGSEALPVRIRALGGREVWIRPGTSDRMVVMDTFLRRIHLPPRGAEVHTILDLGANTGLTARDFAHRYPLEIVCVEMDAANAELARRNLGPVSERARVVEAAAWTCSGTVTYSLSAGAEWAAHIESGGDRQAVAMSLEEITRGFEHVDFVKMDVEGAEADLLGAPGPWIQKSATSRSRCTNPIRSSLPRRPRVRRLRRTRLQHQVPSRGRPKQEETVSSILDSARSVRGWSTAPGTESIGATCGGSVRSARRTGWTAVDPWTAATSTPSSRVTRARFTGACSRCGTTITRALPRSASDSWTSWTSTRRTRFLVEDLSSPGALPSDTYDCVIVTQTLHLVPDIERAVDNIWGLSYRGHGAVEHAGHLPDRRGLRTRRRLLALHARQLAAVPQSAAPHGRRVSRGHGNLVVAIAFLGARSKLDLMRSRSRIRRFPVVACARIDRP